MKACRHCRSKAPNSGEHVFQSAIGGSREVRGVLCKPCNEEYGRTIDLVLIDAFEDFRNLLAIEGDRGQTKTVRRVDSEGREILVRPGGIVEAAPSAPERRQVDERTTQWSAYNEKQAHEIIARAQERNRGKTITVSATVATTFPGAVNIGFNWGGERTEDFCRAAVKTALVLIAARGLEGDDDVLEPAWRYVNGAAPDDCGVSINGSASPAPWADEVIGLVPHRVSVRSVHADGGGFVAADVRYFGDFALCARLDAKLPNEFAIGYGVDPLTLRDVDRDNWTGTIAMPWAVDASAAQAHGVKAFENVLRVAEPRVRRAQIEDAVRKTWRSLNGGQALESAEDKLAFSRAVSQEVVARLFRQDSVTDAPGLARRLQETADKIRQNDPRGGQEGA